MGCFGVPLEFACQDIAQVIRKEVVTMKHEVKEVDSKLNAMKQELMECIREATQK